MTEEKKLKKFLESDDTELVRMGIAMVKGLEVSNETLGEILWLSTFHKDKEIRKAAASGFSKLIPKGEKKPLKKDFTDVKKFHTKYSRTSSDFNNRLSYRQPLFPWSTFSIFKEFYIIDTCFNPKQRLINTLIKFLDKKDIGNNMSFKELKIALKTVGLNVSGKKSELISRFNNFNYKWTRDFMSALDALDWKPDTERQSLLFYLSFRKWDELIKIGKPGIGLLCDYTRHSCKGNFSRGYDYSYDIEPVIALRDISRDISISFSDKEYEKINKILSTVVQKLKTLLTNRTLYESDYDRSWYGPGREEWEYHYWEDCHKVIYDLGEVGTLSAVRALENISIPYGGNPDTAEHINESLKNAKNYLNGRDFKIIELEEKKYKESLEKLKKKRLAEGLRRRKRQKKAEAKRQKKAEAKRQKEADEVAAKFALLKPRRDSLKNRFGALISPSLMNNGNFHLELCYTEKQNDLFRPLRLQAFNLSQDDFAQIINDRHIVLELLTLLSSEKWVTDFDNEAAESQGWLLTELLATSTPDVRWIVACGIVELSCMFDVQDVTLKNYLSCKRPNIFWNQINDKDININVDKIKEALKLLPLLLALHIGSSLYTSMIEIRQKIPNKHNETIFSIMRIFEDPTLAKAILGSLS